MASSASERFLGELTPPLRRNVVALAQHADALADRHVVFTARKSVCVAEALQRLGLWQLPANYTSTRALDGDTSWAAEKDIVLVDDVALSGRTLKGAVDKLRSAGARSVDGIALSVEGDYREWEKTLGITFLVPPVSSSSSDSLRHARSLISSFASLPLPYNIDWPIYRWRDTAPFDALAEQGWMINRQTAQTTNIEVSRHVHNQFMSTGIEWLPALKNRLQFAKIRSYAVPHPEPNGTTHFLVPVVAMGKLSGPDIGRFIGQICETTGSANFFDPQHPAEGYRALQFLLGEFLLEFAIGGVKQSLVCESDHRLLRYLFEPKRVQAVEQVVASIPPVARAIRRGVSGHLRHPLRASDEVESFEEALLSRATVEIADGLLAQHVLTGYLGSEEYALRHSLKAATSAAERSPIVRKLAAVSSSAGGLALDSRMLRRALGGLRVGPTSVPKRRLVSDFLDRAIDSGEIVPVVSVDDGGGVSRKFRAGEVLEFQREAQALAEVSLRSFAAERDVESLSADMVQKLIAGLFRLLMAKDAVRDKRAATSELNHVRDIQFRFHMRGLVLTDLSADFVAERGTPSSLSILVKRGIIEPSSEKAGGYLLPPKPKLEPPAQLEHDAEIYGECIAKLMSFRKPVGGALVDSSTLARIVTLVEPDDQILALAADVAIARSLLDYRFETRAELIQSNLQQAVDQGIAKSRWLVDGRGREVLDTATSEFASADNRRFQSAWRAVASSLRPRDLNPELMSLRDDLVGWIVSAYVYTSGLALLLDTDEKGQRYVASRLSNRHLVSLMDFGEAEFVPLESVTYSLLAALRATPIEQEHLRRMLEALRHHLSDSSGASLKGAHDLARSASGVLPKKSAWKGCVLVESNIRWHRRGTLLKPSSGGPKPPPIHPLESRHLPALTRFGAIAPLNGRRDRIADQLRALVEYVRAHDPKARFLVLAGLPEGFRPGHQEDVLVVPPSFSGLVADASSSGSVGICVVTPAGHEVYPGATSSSRPLGAVDVYYRTWSRTELLIDENQPSLFNHSGVPHPEGIVQHVGDIYNFHGPVGAAGNNASSSGNINIGSVDQATILRELRLLIEAVANNSQAYGGVDDLEGLREAELALQAGDVEKAQGRFARLSKGVLVAARDTGVEVLGAVLANFITS